MNHFTIGAIEVGEERPIDFETFVSIAVGRSIISAADWGDGRFELVLSGSAMIRIFATGDLTVNLIATRNPDEIPPILVEFGDLPQRAPLSAIERKLRGLRTLYAVYFLSLDDRLPFLESYLKDMPQGDFEADLLSDDERLFVESLSYGSWLLTIWAKSKAAYVALSSVAGLVFSRGRDAYLRKLEASAQMAENQSDREAIAAATERFDLRRNQVDYLLEIGDRLESPEIKEIVKQRILRAVDDVLFLDQQDPGSSHRLNAPPSDQTGQA